MSQRLLWISPRWPFPAHDGASIATRSLIKGITQRGVEVDLICMPTPEESIDAASARAEFGLRQISVVRRAKNNLGTKLLELAANPGIPLQMITHAARPIRSAVHEIASSVTAHWDYVVLDGLHAAAHCISHRQFKSIFNSPVIYRAHNHEGLLVRRRAAIASNWIKRRALLALAQYTNVIEASIIQASAFTAAVSSEDCRSIQALHPRSAISVVPIGVGPVNPLPECTSPRLLFIGNLNWPPNKQGLQWFLTNVWPQAVRARPELRLSVAGSGSSAWLTELSHDPTIELLGRVPDMNALYAQHALLIAPIFFGSGTRVKIIEASMYCRTTISTTIGAEGLGLTPGVSYINANSKQEWLNTLQSFDFNTIGAIGQAARRQVLTTFDPDRCAEAFLNLITGS